MAVELTTVDTAESTEDAIERRVADLGGWVETRRKVSTKQGGHWHYVVDCGEVHDGTGSSTDDAAEKLLNGLAASPLVATVRYCDG